MGTYVRQRSVLDLVRVFKVFQHSRYVISSVKFWSGQFALKERHFNLRYECAKFGKHIIAGIGLAASGVSYV